ncbi:MAG TPA: hypothetical protein VKH44_03575 [Pirellulaceae bacterium]|nr:hypothetical protein [Pirellulaceae bacterium]
MLIPRYSIRWLLGLMTFSAGVSLVLSYAVRGHAWAIGITSALWTFVILALFYVAAFLCAWLIDRVATNLRSRRNPTASPFAAVKAGDIPFGGATQQQSADTPPAMTG